MKKFEVGDKVKITDCNTDKMIDVEGTIVYISAKDDIYNYLLRISTDEYKDVGWRIAEGYGCADIPYGLVADYEDDDRYTFWWVAPSEIALVEDEEKEMKAFELGETVCHKTANCTGKIVYIDKYDAVPYLVRFDADSPYGWSMSENRDNVMHLPQSLIDDYIDDEDYKFWWSPATLLEHVDDAQKLKGEEKKMRKFKCNQVVRNREYNMVGVIVFVEDSDIAPYLMRIDAKKHKDAPVGWIMTKADLFSLPKEIVDKYEGNSDYKFWWSTEDNLVAVDKEEESILSRDEKYHDKHYNACVVEPIDAMQHILTAEQFKGFLMGNAIKYRLRAGHKDDVKADIDKALRYELWLKEFEEKGVITL